MLQFVMRDLLEREDIERIREVVQEQEANTSTQGRNTILAIRKQLDKHAVEEQKKSLAKTTTKNASRASGRQMNDEDDDHTLDIPSEEEIDNTIEDDESIAEPMEQHIGGRGVSGGQFGKNYNFNPFLGSLRTGESWEKTKKKARCSQCNKQPRSPFLMSCKHLICSECRIAAEGNAASQDDGFIRCGVCKIIPTYYLQCEVDEDDSPDPVAQGTRSQRAKKQVQKRKRKEREDIADDWLTSIGDDVLPSAKTIAVKAQIINWIKENPEVKVIIYTQFLAM